MVLNLNNLDGFGIGSASDFCKLWVPCSDSKVVDMSGNAFSITAYNNPTYTPLQNGTTALDLNGTNQYFVASIGDGFTFGTGDFTICFWCNMDSYSTKYFFDANSSNPNRCCLIAYGTTDIRFGTDSVLITFTPPTALPTSTWQHFCVLRTSGYMRFYINGVQIGSDQAFSTNFSATTGFVFGTYNNKDSYYADGRFKDIFVFKGIALSLAQIKSIYSATYIE